MYAATWARRLRGARPSRFIIVPIGFGRESREGLREFGWFCYPTKYLLRFGLSGEISRPLHRTVTKIKLKNSHAAKNFPDLFLSSKECSNGKGTHLFLDNLTLRMKQNGHGIKDTAGKSPERL